MKTYLAWCAVMVSVIAHGMEFDIPDIPDDKTIQVQMAAVAQACFKNYPDLTDLQKKYARTSLIEVYVNNKNRILRGLKQGKLEGVHKDQLRASVLSQLEDDVTLAIEKTKRAQQSDEDAALHFNREEQEQRATSYLNTRIFSIIMACFLLNIVLEHYSFI